ncbi:DUF397 domain-containing protein [Actinoallomurus purpureus]|uniref:DUF397 domain-containing protein n=1 Tax=Actinoallomurus purpureus TaxID=478114 RepID=UPI002092FD83|nr:DUF397 domain-containing protein [Actinoallomurus purpureus]MCO6005329.1 DUF397 domain-containing protein [Actinoallomurus purpureus]
MKKEKPMAGIIESAEVLFVDGADVPVEHKHEDHMVVLRDADDPDAVALYYTPNEWEAFILGVKDGEFDDLAAEPDESDLSDDESDGGQAAAFPWTGRPGYPVGGQSRT